MVRRDGIEIGQSLMAQWIGIWASNFTYSVRAKQRAIERYGQRATGRRWPAAGTVNSSDCRSRRKGALS